ncbi:MAG: dihydropteroate synthase [Phycisphaerales bacterium]|nr:dihydropteroate synthase [Phycisphaerales bacterium]
MAILNLTPDSFHDGGVLAGPDAALRAATRAVADGAAVLDIGGESTRPGAAPVSTAEQMARVVPAIRAIREAGLRTPISVDTTRSGVARAALDAGADAVNDTSAGLDDDAMFPLAAERGAGLILMHRPRRPRDDSYSDRYADPPRYGDVVAEVRDHLARRAASAAAAGVDPGAIVLDPGLGFGKTVGQNLELIRRTGEIAALGYPVLSGLSRKSFTGVAAGLAGSVPGERLGGTLALSIAHLRAGASIFRVHDVAEHVHALAIDADGTAP